MDAMPWKRLIDGIEEIVGEPGTEGLMLDGERLEKIQGHMKSLGLSRMRSRDIADGFLALIPRAKRKGKGVYYTPHKVVDYILEEVLPPPRYAKKTRQDPWPEDFRLLEPACGAGYFLLSAFSRFRDAYVKAGFRPEEAVRRTISSRLAGIDIDSGALIATLAGLVQEAGSDLKKALVKSPLYLPLFKSDFLDKEVDTGESYLAEILGSGIPAIAGNPPYVSFYAKRAKSISDEVRDYYKSNYRMGKGRINTYCLFIERAFDLLAPAGVLGFIVPNTVLIMKSYEPLRQHLLQYGWLKSVVDLSLKVFPEVEVPTCVLAVERRDERALPFPRKVRAGFWESARGTAPTDLEDTDQQEFLKLPYTMFNIHIRAADKEILEAIENAGSPLSDGFEVRDGINPANMSDKLICHSVDKLTEPFKRVLRGKDINNYQLNWDNFWVRYDRNFADSTKGEYCFLRDERIFRENPKILTRQTADRIVAAWDETGFYALNTIHVTIPLNGGLDLKTLLALYNSKLLNYYYRLVFPDTERVFPQVKTINVEKLPIPAANGESGQIGKLVDKLLRTIPQNGVSIKNREKVLDEIDKLVYSLYGLNPKQIARIEHMSV
jgi:adenine-specific DNA-methyltransferase